MNSGKIKKGLGRGLSSLMGDVDLIKNVGDNKNQVFDGPFRNVPIANIRPNKHQPRKVFNKDSIQDLAGSIRKNGILQPLLVRPHPLESGMYELVAGERRWRAAQLAQEHNVPVIVRDYDENESLQLSIIENIQRVDLSPIEEANGYYNLMNNFGCTQDDLSNLVNKSRSHIANSLRLRQLPVEVQNMLSENLISAGHARTLLGAKNPIELAKLVKRKGLSVRQLEKIIKLESRSLTLTQETTETKNLEILLGNSLGLRVIINHKGGKGGELKIIYKTLDQLESIKKKLQT